MELLSRRNALALWTIIGLSVPFAPTGMAAPEAADHVTRYRRALRECRFEQPGRPDRLINRPATDPAIAACVQRKAVHD